MGTHISKVKSVDLDVWTPEQMQVHPSVLSFTFYLTCPCLQSILKWGNHRANLYWEAHLKAGHIPPDQYVVSHDFVQNDPNYLLLKQNGVFRALKV
jgi:stromal membrane-associated protein